MKGKQRQLTRSNWPAPQDFIRRKVHNAKSLRHSRLSSLHLQRGKHRFSAEVTYCPHERLLEFRIPIRPRRFAFNIRNRLLGIDSNDCRKRDGKLHFEVMGDEGPDAFLMRIVRRSTSRAGKSSKTQFVFRVRSSSLTILRHQDGDWRLPNSIFCQPALISITFQQAAECVILMAGHDFRVETLFHDGRVHTLGESHPDGRLVRREVNDIN